MEEKESVLVDNRLLGSVFGVSLEGCSLSDFFV